MNCPLVYAIVINWNGCEHLDACFQSLLACPYENAVFLLVDNASTDGSVSLVRDRFGADPRVQILALPENRGWSGGNNAGIDYARAAGADYLFLLNNDTATAPDAIGCLVDRMVADDTLGALAPRMVLFDQPEILNSTGIRLSMSGAAWDIGVGRLDGPAWHAPDAIAGVCGGAMFLRSAALDHAGLLPEDFEIYLDDLDLCLRLWTAGYRIERCAEAVVRHKFSATMGTGARARRKYYLNTRNRFRIVLRHFPRHALAAVSWRIALGEARALGRAVLSGKLWRIPAHLQAWAAALAYLPGAWRFRRTQPVSGVTAFWPLVVPAPLFCPEVVLPSDGWYPSVTHDGRSWRPMARRAWVESPGGTLQVSLANCYPALGEVRVTLYHGDTALDVLTAPGHAECYVEVPPGLIVAIAESTFVLEATGCPADVCAWLRMRCGGQTLL